MWNLFGGRSFERDLSRSVREYLKKLGVYEELKNAKARNWNPLAPKIPDKSIHSFLYYLDKASKRGDVHTPDARERFDLLWGDPEGQTRYGAKHQDLLRKAMRDSPESFEVFKDLIELVSQSRRQQVILFKPQNEERWRALVENQGLRNVDWLRAEAGSLANNITTRINNVEFCINLSPSSPGYEKASGYNLMFTTRIGGRSEKFSYSFNGRELKLPYTYNLIIRNIFRVERAILLATIEKLLLSNPDESRIVNRLAELDRSSPSGKTYATVRQVRADLVRIEGGSPVFSTAGKKKLDEIESRALQSHVAEIFDISKWAYRADSFRETESKARIRVQQSISGILQRWKDLETELANSRLYPNGRDTLEQRGEDWIEEVHITYRPEAEVAVELKHIQEAYSNAVRSSDQSVEIEKELSLRSSFASLLRSHYHHLGITFIGPLEKIKLLYGALRHSNFC